MSCHNIGTAINSIMAQVLEMYDEGKISQKVAQEMVWTFPKAVNWCDGNENEAQETLTNTHCAICLKKYETPEDKIKYTDLNLYLDKEDRVEAYRDNAFWWFDEMKLIGANGNSVCRHCFSKYLAKGLTPKGCEKLFASKQLLRSTDSTK